MTFVHGIVGVNRSDLTERAVQSIRDIWDHAFLLDNSPDGSIGRSRSWEIEVIRPSVPLSCGQSMNYLHRIAKERGARVFGYQHNDCQAAPGMIRKLYQRTQEIEDSRFMWASCWTKDLVHGNTYDFLSTYKVAVVDEIGPWDWMFPNPNYHIDTDWFYRAKVEGFTHVQLDDVLCSHQGSSTTTSDAYRNRINELGLAYNEAYYRQKWGGPPFQEVFKKPWNGA